MGLPCAGLTGGDDHHGPVLRDRAPRCCREDHTLQYVEALLPGEYDWGESSS